MEYLQLVSVPAIATIVYWTINIIKYATNSNETFKRFIPIVAAVLGALLGIGCFYLVPSIMPATNLAVAIIIGASSGLTAVGTDQILKQIEKKENNSDNAKSE